MRRFKKYSNRQPGISGQSGSAVLLAATSIIVLGTGLVMAQLTASKSDTSASAGAEAAVTGAQQAAALAAAAGVSVVNNLSSSGTCASSTGCSGVYGIGVLSGGAAGQSASWWSNSANVRPYSYQGVNSAAYVIEELDCDSSTGLTNYRVTGRAMSSSKTGLQGESVVLYQKRASKTWTPTTTTVTFYDYSCDATSFSFGYVNGSGLAGVSFVAGASSNISPYNVNRPYPAFPASGATGKITQIEAGIGNWSSSTSVNLKISLGGTQLYTSTCNGSQGLCNTSSPTSGGSVAYNGSLSSGPMSNRGYSRCSSGNNMSVYTLPSPITVTSGQLVGILFTNQCGLCAIHFGTAGKSPGNNLSSQIRYRVIGTQTTNACPVAS